MGRCSVSSEFPATVNDNLMKKGLLFIGLLGVVAIGCDYRKLGPELQYKQENVQQIRKSLEMPVDTTSVGADQTKHNVENVESKSSD
jgi:hypothetical protein